MMRVNVTLLYNCLNTQNLQHTVPGYVLEGDIDFREISFFPPLLAFIIGILCNILGIGGGELLGPLLLWMKVDPQVKIGLMAFRHCLLHKIVVYFFLSLRVQQLR